MLYYSACYTKLSYSECFSLFDLHNVAIRFILDLVQKNVRLSHNTEDKVFILVCKRALEVFADDAVPRRAKLFVALLLHSCRDHLVVLGGHCIHSFFYDNFYISLDLGVLIHIRRYLVKALCCLRERRE